MWITVYKTDPTGVAIHGLRDSDIAACRDEIQQLVFVSHKIFLTRHKVVYLMRKCNQKLEELSKMCFKLSMPPLHDNDRNPSKKYYIFVSGKTKDVETVRQQLIELIGDQFNVEMFTVKSPDFMVGVWKRRWALVKNELEEKHDVIIDFSQSGAPQVGRRGSAPVTGRKVFKEDQQVVINFEVFGPDNEKVSEIRKHIEENENGRVVSVQIPVSENNRRVDHPSVLAQNANLQDMMVWLRFQGNQLLLFAPVSAIDDLEAAKTALIHYLEETATKTENIDCIDELSFDILVNDCDFFLGKANAIAKQKHVTIRISKVKSTFVLNGSPSGIDVIKPLVDAALQKVQKTIDTKSIEVSFIKAPFLKTPDFKQFCSSTRQKNLVDIIVSSSSSNEVVKQVQIQPFPTCHGLQVSLIKGDILKEDTDAIVNAANEDLEHIGGLAKSILDAAGSTIQEESRLYVHRYGKVNPGKAVCLSSGDLPCRKIIHAVAPRWKGGLGNERAVLYNAVKMSLQQAQKNNLATIAFPALGTGIFAVPVDVCAQASIQALRDYCNEKASSCVTDVRFVLNTSSACHAFLSTLDKFSKPSVLHTTMPGMTWQWKDDTGKYNPYDPSICTKLTEQFRRDRSKVCSVILNGTTYNVDFQQMVQINTSTSFRRSIKFSFGESSMIEEDSKPQWYYKNDQEQWTPYLPNDSIQLETWYQSDMSGVLAIGKFQYSFDFEQMTQINNRTKTKRSIKREVKGCSDDTESPKWYFQNDSQEFQPYLPEDSKQIEEWYQSGSQSNALTIRRNTYSFDFTTMQQCNMLTGNKRVIKREGNDSEIIPQDLKPVMLKLRGAGKSIDAVLIQLQSKLDGCLSNEELKLPEAIELSSIKRVVRKHGIEVTIRNVGTNQMATLTGVHDMLKKCHTEIQALIIAHMENKVGEMKFETPKEWQKQSETVEVFPVTVGSAEWNHVAHKFEETTSSSEIVSIERIQNQWLWQKYTQQRNMMHQKNNGKVNEMELFHGTRLNDPKSIYDSEEGFDMRFSAQGMWGQANYFAVNASYSNRYGHQLPDKSGNNQIFLAKVLTGDSSSCGSDSRLRMPPEKPSYAAATGGVKLAQLRYDTVTGSTGGSIVYMTYDNLKAYPAYLITYQQHKRFGFF